MYYVSMTDKFMSGWGMAEGKTNKLVILCDTYAEAEIVAENADSRPEQIYVTIRTKKPYYNKDKYYTQYKTKDEMSRWFEIGAFKK